MVFSHAPLISFWSIACSTMWFHSRLLEKFPVFLLPLLSSLVALELKNIYSVLSQSSTFILTQWLIRYIDISALQSVPRALEKTVFDCWWLESATYVSLVHLICSVILALCIFNDLLSLCYLPIESGALKSKYIKLLMLPFIFSVPSMVYVF